MLMSTEAGKCCGVSNCKVNPNRTDTWRTTGYWSNDNGGTGCYADNKLTGMGTSLNGGAPTSVAVPPSMKDKYKGSKVCIKDLDNHYNNGNPISFQVDDITAEPAKKFGGEQRIDICFNKTDKPVTPQIGSKPGTKRNSDPRFDAFLNQAQGHSVIICE